MILDVDVESPQRDLGGFALLGRRKGQESLFALESLLGKEQIPEGSVYWAFAHDQGRVARDEDYAAMYRPGGRPSWPPSLMVKVLLLQMADGAADREAEQRCQFDLRWKYALGLELQEKGPDATTLCTFRARLLANEQGRKAFSSSLRWAKDGDWVQGEVEELVDSLATAGAGAQQDTFTLIRKALRQLARSLHGHDRHGTWAEQVLAEPDRKPAVAWDDAVAKNAALAALLAEADEALERTAEGEYSEEVVQARALLVRVCGQDVERTDSGAQIRRGVAQDRICSVTDPEMRHGRKSSTGTFSGYKVDLGMDSASEIVTHITPIAGNAPDGQHLAEQVRGVESELGVSVSRVIGDTAYGRPQVRQALEQDGRSVVAPLQEPTNRGLFTKDDFVIDLGWRLCCCPNGNLGRARLDSQGNLSGFSFAAKQCARCPLRAQCTTSRHGRSVTIQPDEARRQELRMQQATPEWQQIYHRRPRIEGKIAECKRHGLGRARYLGLAKLQLQAWLTAALVNFKRIAKLMQGGSLAVTATG